MFVSSMQLDLILHLSRAEGLDRVATKLFVSIDMLLNSLALQSLNVPCGSKSIWWFTW